MQDDKGHCIRCDDYTAIYSYCESDGTPYCQVCWQIHVATCNLCRSASDLDDDVEEDSSTKREA